jgi:gluconolactonase
MMGQKAQTPGDGAAEALFAGMAGDASRVVSQAETPGVLAGAREMGRGLHFPEGPIACADGSVLVVEIAAPALTRVAPDGAVNRIILLQGGPNGAAIGPDGACYICNNGGLSFTETAETIAPSGRPASYAGGWIDRVNLAAGVVLRLYDRSSSGPLVGPNDIVFDADGGFWFTDIGDFSEASPLGSICYATIDGRSCRVVVPNLRSPNGIGLSPDGRTLYFADTVMASVYAFDVIGPGDIDARSLAGGGRLIGVAEAGRMLDSLAVDADGRIAVGTLGQPGGITIFDPAGAPPVFMPLPDAMVTNLCFGGPERRTAYVTLSSTGRLLAIENLARGCALNFA